MSINKLKYCELKGFQILSYKMEEKEDEFGYRALPTFILERGKQQIKITISQDENGIDGGFLLIEDNKEVI